MLLLQVFGKLHSRPQAYINRLYSVWEGNIGIYPSLRLGLYCLRAASSEIDMALTEGLVRYWCCTNSTNRIYSVYYTKITLYIYFVFKFLYISTLILFIYFSEIIIKKSIIMKEIYINAYIISSTINCKLQW